MKLKGKKELEIEKYFLFQITLQHNKPVIYDDKFWQLHERVFPKVLLHIWGQKVGLAI